MGLIKRFLDWAFLVNGPSSSVANIDDAVSKKHSHTNSSVLDDLSDTGGALYYNGSSVGGTGSNLVWSEKFIIYKPSNGYVSPYSPLTRAGTSDAFKFFPDGVPSGATSVYTFQGNTIMLSADITNVATSATTSSTLTNATPFYALIEKEVVQVTAINGTTITITRAQNGTTAAAHTSGAIVLLPVGSVSLSSRSSVTLTLTDLTGASDDLFAYNVSGTGLADISVTVKQEWVNA